MKGRVTVLRLVTIGLLLAGGLVVAPVPALAQDKPVLDLENDPEYQETQKFLAETENKISKVRAETDARAAEIEALANRVGDLIANISSTNEDASNLRSELSVVNDLLAIERQTTDGLRKDLGGLTTQLTTLQAERKSKEEKLNATIAALRAENAKALKRLNEAVETIADQAKTNQVLASDLEEAKQEMDRLEKEVTLLKKGRYRPRRRTAR